MPRWRVQTVLELLPQQGRMVHFCWYEALTNQLV